jgi:hypothetical protein
MADGKKVTIQSLMDRFREASCDLFNRYFDDAFAADRFCWVENAMFLVMVLNYVNLGAPKHAYPELFFHPSTGAKAALQGRNGQLVELGPDCVLHYRCLLNEQDTGRDARWVLAVIATAHDPTLIGQEVLMDYADCSFIGSVDAEDL